VFRLSSRDGVWNLFKEITTTSQRQEISDWYHLKENLYKVGGERQRIKQAEALLWRGRVEDARAIFDNCHRRQAINFRASKNTVWALWTMSGTSPACGGSSA